MQICSEDLNIPDRGFQKLHIIAKSFGSAGTADPLNQACTIGWKVDGMKALILNGDWLVRVESAVAA